MGSASARISRSCVGYTEYVCNSRLSFSLSPRGAGLEPAHGLRSLSKSSRALDAARIAAAAAIRTDSLRKPIRSVNTDSNSASHPGIIPTPEARLPRTTASKALDTVARTMVGVDGTAKISVKDHELDSGEIVKAHIQVSQRFRSVTYVLQVHIYRLVIRQGLKVSIEVHA